MSRTLTTCGDNFHRGWNEFAAVPLGGYTPAVGDLVTYETGAANTVDLIAGIEAIAAIVDSVNSGSGVVTICELVAGCRLELPYTGTVALGDKVKFSSATHGTALDRTQVQTDNSNGIGLVIAVDADAPHGVGHCVVRFS